jgi:uncharacterized membrane protein
MRSRLIAMIFEKEGEASRVYEALHRMRGSSLLGLENAAAVTKDGHGNLAVTQKRELSPTGVVQDDNLTRLTTALLFGEPPDEMLQSLARKGFDVRFREQVARAMANCSSAFLILMPQDSQVDRDRLLGILKLFKGIVFETTLPQEAEAALAEGWEA